MINHMKEKERCKLESHISELSNEKMIRIIKIQREIRHHSEVRVDFF